jgi:hypothetical protein
MTDFVALHAINAPNTYARAYNQGDPVHADVVTAWELVIGDDPDTADVRVGDGYAHPRPEEDSGDRTAWEAYVVGKGTDPTEARAASLDDLRGMYEPDPEPDPPAHDLPAAVAPEGVDGTGVQNPTPVADNVPAPVEGTPDGDDRDRPAESARKSEWVAYVVDSGGDRAWANADDTTKADLIEWKPDGQ